MEDVRTESRSRIFSPVAAIEKVVLVLVYRCLYAAVCMPRNGAKPKVADDIIQSPGKGSHLVERYIGASKRY